MQTVRVPVGRVPQIKKKNTCEGRKIPFPTTYLESFIYCPSNTLVIESESYLACGC
jgi:hypothetical protein